MAKKRSSARKKPEITINWRFRFWWPDADHNDRKNIPANRLNKGGYEMMGSNRVTVEALQNDQVLQKDGKDITTKGRSLITISQIIDDLMTAHGAGVYTLRLTAPEGMQSQHPAGPHMKEPEGELNTSYRVAMRPLSFDIELDASGKIIKPLADERVFMPYSEADRPDFAPAPHGSVIMKESGGDIEFVMDWKFDWFSRHSPDHQPVHNSRTRRNGDDSIDLLMLHITGGSSVESTIQEFFAPGKTKGIHYIVDIDGHAIKTSEEEHALTHAGFADRRKQAFLDEKGFDRQSYSSNWGMKDLGKSSSIFRRSVGIEHLIGLKEKFPQAMIDGSTLLSEKICNHYGIEPWHVMGHADGLTLKGKNRLPEGGSQVAVAEFTKACPGSDFPWNAYQDYVNKDGVRRPISLGPAHGVAAEPEATIYRGIFTHLSHLAKSTSDESIKTIQTQAIEDLQKDLRRMGYWCPGWKSSPRKKVRNEATYGELDFGVFDKATHGAVRLFQRRCMIPRGDSVTKQGRVDLLTAQRIRQTVSTPDLPPLELPLPAPP